MNIIITLILCVVFPFLAIPFHELGHYLACLYYKANPSFGRRGIDFCIYHETIDSQRGEYFISFAGFLGSAPILALYLLYVGIWQFIAVFALWFCYGISEMASKRKMLREEDEE